MRSNRNLGKNITEPSSCWDHRSIQVTAAYHPVFSAIKNAGASHRNPTCASYRSGFISAMNCAPKRSSSTDCTAPVSRNERNTVWGTCTV